MQAQIGFEFPQMIAIIWQALLLGTFLQVPHYGLWPCETAKRLKSRVAERLALETNDKCFGLGAFRTARALTHAPSVREEDVHPPVPRVLAAVESAFISVPGLSGNHYGDL
jgi:hypothetical protein